MTFERAFALTSQLEGGVADRKADRGGHTYRGVRQATFDLWCDANKMERRDVVTMTDAEYTSLAFVQYWKGAHCDLLRERLGCMQYDSAFNHGQANATRLLQEACGAEVDGAWGPETLAKATAGDEIQILDKYLDARKAFYQHIVDNDATGLQVQNLKGWNNRLAALRRALEP